MQHGRVPYVLLHAYLHDVVKHDALRCGEAKLDDARALVRGGVMHHDGFVFARTFQGGRGGQSHERTREDDGPHHVTHGVHRKDGNGCTYRDHDQASGSHHGRQNQASRCTAFRIRHRDAEDAHHHGLDDGRNEQQDGLHSFGAARIHRNEEQSPVSQGSVLPLEHLRLHHRPRVT